MGPLATKEGPDPRAVAPATARSSALSEVVSREAYVIGGLLALAALVRFSTLGLQSFDYDELQTVTLMHEPLGDLVSRIANEESTPPLYYLVAWIWSKPFGTGEVALRALSALLGAAAVPAAYAAARELASRRVATIVGALVIFSPWLVWYSQEARAYSLVSLLGALSFWAFLRSLSKPTARSLAAWAATSALAMAAHYFAMFLVAPEALWLLWRSRGRLPELVAVGAVAAAAIALLPLALYQRAQGHGGEMISVSGSLLVRALQVPKQSLVGFDAPAEAILTLATGAIVGCGVFLLVRRGTRTEHSAARVPAAIAGSAVLVPLVMALVGLDYIVTRNVIVAWVPAAIVVALGLGCARAGRAGTLAAAVLVGLFAATTVSVWLEPSFQRDDWRGAARSLGTATIDRAIVLTPAGPPWPWAVYLPGLRDLPAGGARVREIDAVAIANVLQHPGGGRELPAPGEVTPPAPGFHAAGRARGALYETFRFRSPEPVRVKPAALRDGGLQAGVTTAIFLQPALR
jgi:mannosyltransferase